MTGRLAIASALVFVAAAAWPADAHASPSLPDIVCQQVALGQSPGQVADELHQGDPRIGWGQAANTVWSSLQDCDG